MFYNVHALVPTQEEDDYDEGDTVAPPSKSTETFGRSKRQHERKKRK